MMPSDKFKNMIYEEVQDTGLELSKLLDLLIEYSAKVAIGDYCNITEETQWNDWAKAYIYNQIVQIYQDNTGG